MGFDVVPIEDDESYWTNSYFIPAESVAPLDVIKKYIESQKTSQRQK